MEAHVEAMTAGKADEKVWLLEHPPVYTTGASAAPRELLAPGDIPVYPAGRGGRTTYHGPGQRVAYVMIDLRKRGCDLRAYVRFLENWVRTALARLGVKAEPREGRVGLWVVRGGQEEKIAAIGVRVRRWVTWHGVSINVEPDLSHFSGIVPCGLDGYGVTSLRALGLKAGMKELDEALKKSWKDDFGAATIPNIL